MAIVAYVGRPRSGKSYGVVENVIIPALKSGRTIVTNIPLKTGYLSDDFPEGRVVQFKPREPLENTDFWDLDSHPGCIWVIDECWRYWKSGTTAKNIPEIEQKFFAEHGHTVGDDGRTTEIVLVTQNLDQVASFVRNLVEETFRATKLSALGAKNKYRVDVFTGAQKGLDGGKPNRQLTGTYKPEIYKYYTSHTNNKTDFAAGMEEKADDRNNIFKGGFFKFGIPLALLLMCYSVWSLLSYFSPDEPQEKPPVKQLFDVPSDSSPAPSPVNAPMSSIADRRKAFQLEFELSHEALPLSETHRIVGHIGNKLMIYSEKGTRLVPDFRCGRFSNTKEDYCVLYGELVTWYSSDIPTEDTPRSYFESDRLVEDVF